MANVYSNAMILLGQGLDFDTPGDVFKLMLVNASESFNAADVYVSDVVANELSDASYGRVTLEDGNVVTDGGTGADIEFTEADFGALSGGETINAAILFKFVTNDADSPLMAFFDLTNTVTNGSEVKVQFNSKASAGEAINIDNA